jgi:class 3 adenylate cyclase/DNA-binding CsgD family transcriptional regulator/tetratricopeptide (TPR) repeat protein
MIPSEGVVALLFTDLVGSTELLDRMGDDAAEVLRRTYFSMLRQAVAEAGGREVKSLGDGLMVAFTSPVKAVSCAVSMQRAIDEHNRRNPESGLQVRIGLHAGEPVRDEEDLFGSSVVVAKRLCDQARGGQILASELVANLVGSRGGFRFRPIGRLRLKGLAQALPTVIVDPESGEERSPRPSVPARPASPRAPALRGPRLVGRDRELGFFESEFKRVEDEGLRCVLLVGDAGVGKTRLASEIAARHRTTTAGLSARAHPLGATVPFGLWAEALERYLRTLPAEEIWRVCGGFLDDLACLLYSVAAVRGSAPEGERPRHRLLEGLAVVLANLAAHQPVVVILDDVHLADPSSWEALHYLADRLSDAHLLLVATARPAELAQHEAAAPVLLDLEREHMLTRLELDPLEPAAVEELAHAVLARAPPRPLVEWLNERTLGNPLFAMGLLRALEEEGANLSAPHLHRVPQHLADQVLARLRALDEPARAVLEVLAVLGRRVDFGDLVALGGRSVEDLGPILDELVHSRLALEEERGRQLSYEIAHPLVQETIYQAIGKARRRGLHRLVARALLAGDRLGEAAAHFARSAEVGDSEAIDALRDAVRQAEDRGAYREGLTILGALVALLPPGDLRWVDVLDALSWTPEWVVEHRGDAGDVMGARAMRAIDAVLEESPDAARRAKAKYRLATFLVWGTGELEEAERVAAEAAELFEAAGDVEAALLARNELATVKAVEGNLREGLERTWSVLHAAEAANEPFATLQATFLVGINLFWLGRLDESEAWLRRSVDLARSQGRHYRITVGLTLLALSRAYGGGIEEGLALLEEAKSFPSWRESILPEWQAIVQWLAGDFPTAAANGADSLARNPGGVGRRRAVGLPFASMSAVEMGELAEARRYVEEARAACDRLAVHAPCCLHAEAVLAWREEEGSEPAAQLHQAALTLLEMGAPHFAAPVLVDLAEVSALTQRADMAREAAAQLQGIARHLKRDFYAALAGLGDAWAILASGSPQRGADPAGRAVVLLRPTGYRAFLGRALEVLGRSLSTSDRSRAAEALQEAAAAFETCGARWRRDRSLETLRGLGSRGRRIAATALGPASLTRRERQVARLAAQGHTIRQIGERLFIGEHTVETHLSNVYAKLGVRSKSELVGRVSEFEL